MLRKEVQRLEETAHELEMEGWRQMRAAVAGSEVEGLYGLLKGVASHPHPTTSHPPMKKPHLSPSSSTITQSTLQESTGPKVSDPLGQATGSTPLDVTPALEEDILANMQPLRVQVGVLGMCISAGWRVVKRAHQPHGPLLVPILERFTWGWGWHTLFVTGHSSTQMCYSITKRLIIKIC